MTRSNTSFSRFSLLPLVLILALIAPQAPAAKTGDALAPLVDTVQVEVVNVDVVVMDKFGNPVRGLTKNDFVIHEDGKARELTNFFAFEEGMNLLPGEVRQVKEELPAAPMRRRMALLFDNNTLDRRSRDKALESVERFILEQFDGTYEWAVVSYGDDLQIMEPFTSDKTRVLGALSLIRDLPVAVRKRPPATGLITEDPIYGGQVGESSTITPREFEIRERTMENLKTFNKTIEAMVQTMRAYAGLPGRKSLVLVTGVLETLPSADQLLGQSFPGVGSGADENGRPDSVLVWLNTDLVKTIDGVVKIANTAGFSVYPVSAQAFSAGQSPHLEVERRGTPLVQGGFSTIPTPVDADSTPRSIADGTGGAYFASTRYYKTFDEIDSRTANSYVLGYTTDHAPEGEYHNLKVEVKKPGFTVHSRRGFLHLTTEDRVLEMLATPLAFPKDQGDFSVSVEFGEPERAGKKKFKISVAGVMPISRVTMVPQGKTGVAGRVLMYLAIYDTEGELVDLIRRHRDINLPAKAIQGVSPDHPAKFGFTVSDLEAGDYTMTLTLMDEVTTRYGTGLSRVQI